jgi:dihydrofolate reductase
MAIAAGDKNLWIVGGGDLAGQFYDAGLLDELVVQIASVALGGGAPLFPRRVDPPLQWLSAKTYGHNFAELHYRVVGPRRR